MRKFLFDKEPDGTGSTGGTGITLEELQKQIENLKEENAILKKDVNTYKSQAGDFKKQFETLQKNGKSQEELDKLEIERLSGELKKATETLNLTKLQSRKLELIEEFKINSHFSDLITVNPEMTEEQLKNNAKSVAEKQKAFLNDTLKEYSITTTPEEAKKEKQTTDFIDSLADKSLNVDTDLTKF